MAAGGFLQLEMLIQLVKRLEAFASYWMSAIVAGSSINQRFMLTPAYAHGSFASCSLPLSQGPERLEPDEACLANQRKRPTKADLDQTGMSTHSPTRCLRKVRFIQMIPPRKV